LTVWVSDPLVPLIASVRVPRASSVDVFTVRTDVVAPLPIGLGLNVAVSRVVCPLTLSATLPVNPFVRVIVTVYVVVVPRVIVRLVGDTLIEKLGVATVSVTVVVWTAVPVAVTVRG
jgi:hypothetical protein